MQLHLSKKQLRTLANALSIAHNTTQQEAVALWDDAPQTSRALVEESESYAELLAVISRNIPAVEG